MPSMVLSHQHLMNIRVCERSGSLLLKSFIHRVMAKNKKSYQFMQLIYLHVYITIHCTIYSECKWFGLHWSAQILSMKCCKRKRMSPVLCKVWVTYNYPVYFINKLISGCTVRWANTSLLSERAYRWNTAG